MLRLTILTSLFQILIGLTLSYAQQNEVPTVISVPHGTPFLKDFSLSPDSKAYKQNTPYVSQETVFNILIDQYDKGEKQMARNLGNMYLDKGKRIIFEIVPEHNKNDNLLKIMFNIPGSSLLQYFQTQQGSIYKWIDYSIVTDEIIDKPIPLIIIYEDTNGADNLENKLDILTKNNTLPLTMSSKLENDILKILNNYYLISYRLSKR